MNINFKGLPIHYEIFGDGLPLIFLHGFNENCRIWDLTVPKISEHYKCIIVDLPGFGHSPLPAKLSLTYLANALHRIIEELNLDKPIVVGHSMGGYVALEFAHTYPNTLGGACLFHSTALADSAYKKENRLKTLDFLENNPVDLFYKVFIPGLFAPHNLNPRIVELTEKIIKQTVQESVIEGTKAMLERADRTDVLKNSRYPWLFIAGKFDQLIPIEHLSLQSSYCELSQFEILTNSGHMGMIEEPTKTLEILIKFANWCTTLKK